MENNGDTAPEPPTSEIRDRSPVPDYPSMLRLDGRRYVVAGAGQGIGRQTAHSLAQAGAEKILCVDIDVDRARAVAEEIDTVAGRSVALAWSGDVTGRGDAARLADDAERLFGAVDGLVDIIGIARWESILDMTDETFDWEIDMCFRHAFLLSQELGRRMVDTGGGSMVFVSSVSGLTGAPMHAAYGAAKAGLNAWVQSLAVELGPRKVRANTVAPGSILTPRMDALFDERQRKANGMNAPLERMAATSEIASTILFLLSDLASYLTGQTLVVDGGVSAKFPYQHL